MSRYKLSNGSEDITMTAQELHDEREDAKEEAFKAGLTAAAAHVRAHSCVSSCCDAQPSAGEAEALAKCIEQLKVPEDL